MKIDLIKNVNIHVEDVIAKKGVSKDDTFETMCEKVRAYITETFGENHKASGFEINNIVCEIKVALDK